MRDATLRYEDITKEIAGREKGVRVLVLQEGRFWPARALETQLEGVFEVHLEQTRNNKFILALDEMKQQGVRLFFSWF